MLGMTVAVAVAIEEASNCLIFKAFEDFRSFYRKVKVFPTY